MSYASAAALRAALDARLLAIAQERRVDVARLRRVLVFERLLARLEVAEPGAWVLKGGMALELRLGGAARSTKDLDLAVLAAGDPDGEALARRLRAALEVDRDGDRLLYAVAPLEPLRGADAGGPGWTAHADVGLAGRTFAAVRLDVVARTAELGATEAVRLPGLMEFAGVPTRSVQAVDRAQHLAEKLHAMTRDYGGRPSTRVRDLVDVVLLLDLAPPSDEELGCAVRRVFRARGTHSPPRELPDPPADWGPRYAREAAAIGAADRDLASAMGRARTAWARAMRTGAR